MRFTKLVSLAFVTAALAVPVATAGDGHGNPNKPTKPSKACKMVSVTLTGSFVAAASDGTSFQMNAKKANRNGRMYLKAAQPMTVNVDGHTRFSKGHGKTTLADLVANDRLVMHAKACKRDLRGAKTPDLLPALTARLVLAKTPKAPKQPPPPPAP